MQITVIFTDSLNGNEVARLSGMFRANTPANRCKLLNTAHAHFGIKSHTITHKFIAG